MELYLDSAALDELHRWLATGVISGATTNPTVLKESCGDRPHREVLAELAEVIAPLPLSIEILKADPDGVVEEATDLATIGDNVVVKVPMLLPDGSHTLAAVRELEQCGVTINVTACLSAPQLWLAFRAGASYASLLWGRAHDEGGDPARAIELVNAWMSAAGDDAARGKIILGSIRTVRDVYEALSSGADVMTVPSELLEKLTAHKLALATSEQFFTDGSDLLECDHAVGRA